MTLGVTSPQGDLGPGVLNWDAAGDDIDMFPTNGQILVKGEQASRDIKEDGHGDMPVDKVTMGKPTTIEVDLTRLAYAKLIFAIYGSTGGVTNLVIKNKVGQALYADAKGVIIKPISDGDTIDPDTSKWWYFFKCAILESLELPYSTEDQRNWKVTLAVFPDNTSGNEGGISRLGPA